MNKMLKIVLVVASILGGLCFVFNKDIQTFIIRGDTKRFCTGKTVEDRTKCNAKIDENFDRCVGPLREPTGTTAGFLKCLGIEIESPPAS